jgi:hypothetical protein
MLWGRGLLAPDRDQLQMSECVRVSGMKCTWRGLLSVSSLRSSSIASVLCRTRQARASLMAFARIHKLHTLVFIGDF